MITVAILINGNPIVARNAINQARTNDLGETEYLTDSGETIWHHRDDGAVELAHRLLNLIRNDKPRAKCDRCDGVADPEAKLPDGVTSYEQVCKECADELHERESKMVD